MSNEDARSSHAWHPVWHPCLPASAPQMSVAAVAPRPGRVCRGRSDLLPRHHRAILPQRAQGRIVTRWTRYGHVFEVMSAYFSHNLLAFGSLDRAWPPSSALMMPRVVCPSCELLAISAGVSCPARPAPHRGTPHHRLARRRAAASTRETEVGRRRTWPAKKRLTRVSQNLALLNTGQWVYD